MNLCFGNLHILHCVLDIPAFVVAYLDFEIQEPCETCQSRRVPRNQIHFIPISYLAFRPCLAGLVGSIPPIYGRVYFVGNVQRRECHQSEHSFAAPTSAPKFL